jgi:hypothetical protein
MRLRLLDVLVGLSLLLSVAVVAFLAWWGTPQDPRETNKANTGWAWSPAAVKATKARGDEVAHAIDRFRKDTNRYPKSLDELAQAYVDTIPAPTVGNRQWRYRVAQGSPGFILSVTGDRMADPELYRTATDSWVLDDK